MVTLVQLLLRLNVLQCQAVRDLGALYAFIKSKVCSSETDCFFESSQRMISRQKACQVVSQSADHMQQRAVL